MKDKQGLEVELEWLDLSPIRAYCFPSISSSTDFSLLWIINYLTMLYSMLSISRGYADRRPAENFDINTTLNACYSRLIL